MVGKIVVLGLKIGLAYFDCKSSNFPVKRKNQMNEKIK